MWLAIGEVTSWNSATSASSPMVAGSRSRKPRPSRMSSRPSTWGFVAECIRVSTSGNRRIPMAAIKVSRAPSTRQAAATTSATSVQLTALS